MSRTGTRKLHVAFSPADMQLYEELMSRGLSAGAIADQMPGRTRSQIQKLTDRLRRAEKTKLLADGSITWTSANVEKLRSYVAAATTESRS